MRKWIAILAVGLIGWTVAVAAAAGQQTTQPPAPAGGHPQAAIVEVLSGLDNPCGVAIQPETGTIYVSESGAGQVVRIVEGKPQPVITGFPVDAFGENPAYAIGPLGLAFLGKQSLVVGGGGQADGEEVVSVYEVGEAADPLPADRTTDKLGPIPAGDMTASGEGDFFNLAATEAAVYVTSHGDDGKGWVLMAELRGGKPTGLRPFLATKLATGADTPGGMTVSPEGFLVVAQMGKVDQGGDSLLAFYDARSGKLLLSLATGLRDITALAYSPKTGRLYALDFAWHAPEQGGLFRLDQQIKNGRQAVAAVRIAALDKPTAMAFDKDGRLYVTVFGTRAEDATEKPGKLLLIEGNL